ncbi:MAG TPA: hypothetical protein VMZ53_18970 [Kofleriaceae bacterium]|nr:hypothetical protein [Kofleriaceae bacterium]
MLLLAPPLQSSTAMTTFQTIDPSLLVTATGGQAQGPEQGDDQQPQGRSWKQIAGEYTNACIQGAGQALIFGGKPRNWRQGATTAAMGCAMGVGMKALEDGGSYITGSR